MMIKKLLILILLLTSCSVTTPKEPLQTLIIQGTTTPWQCIDTLAGATYPGEVRKIPNQIGIGVFARTFTDAFSLVKNELEHGRRFVRVNLLWSDTHSYGTKDLAFIRSESKRYSPLCDRFPGKLFLAPLTEHNVRDPAQYLNAAQANAPNCTIVNTPWRGGYTDNPKYINEVHGNHSIPPSNVWYAHSDDGTQSVDTNVTKTKKKWSGSLYNCFWGRSHNLRTNADDTASRPQRIREADWRKPSREYNESHVYLYNDRGPTSVPSKWIVKSHADVHKGDNKSNKMVIIASVAKKRNGKNLPIELIRNGQKVCTASYYGPYSDIKGFHRYYTSTYAYQCGPDLDMFFNGQKYGRISGGFRDGTKYYE